MNAAVIIAIIVALIGGGGIGGVIAATSGIFKDIGAQRKDNAAVQVAKDKEEREAFNAIISQALSTMSFLDSQVKTLRTEAITDATRQATELQAMRDQIRILSLRVAELEAERAKDKERIYELEHGVRTRPTRKTNTPL